MEADTSVARGDWEVRDGGLRSKRNDAADCKVDTKLLPAIALSLEINVACIGNNHETEVVQQSPESFTIVYAKHRHMMLTQWLLAHCLPCGSATAFVQLRGPGEYELVSCCRADESVAPYLPINKRSYLFGGMSAATAHFTIWLLPEIQVCLSV